MDFRCERGNSLPCGVERSKRTSPIPDLKINHLNLQIYYVIMAALLPLGLGN
jgi:hypothetical protein